MIQDIFGLPVNLASPFDFSFLGRYGRPFCVFDNLPDGDICFGMESGQYGKLLCRFAGAPVLGALRRPEEAAAFLRQAAPLYTLLRHKNLIPLRGEGSVAGGYALIFRWPEGEKLHLADTKKRLRNQPLITRLRMLDHVFDFHTFR